MCFKANRKKHLRMRDVKTTLSHLSLEEPSPGLPASGIIICGWNQPAKLKTSTKNLQKALIFSFTCIGMEVSICKLMLAECLRGCHYRERGGETLTWQDPARSCPRWTGPGNTGLRPGNEAAKQRSWIAIVTTILLNIQVKHVGYIHPATRACWQGKASNCLVHCLPAPPLYLSVESPPLQPVELCTPVGRSAW